jgi:hypothetical protein
MGTFAKNLDNSQIFEEMTESGVSLNVHRMIVVEQRCFLALKLLTAVPWRVAGSGVIECGWRFWLVKPSRTK